MAFFVQITRIENCDTSRKKPWESPRKIKQRCMLLRIPTDLRASRRMSMPPSIVFLISVPDMLVIKVVTLTCEMSAKSVNTNP